MSRNAFVGQVFNLRCRLKVCTTMPAMHGLLLWVAWIYSIYFMLTGIWPVVHMPSFIAVTGPKTDLWLVRTVGLLIAGIGLCSLRDRCDLRG